MLFKLLNGILLLNHVSCLVNIFSQISTVVSTTHVNNSNRHKNELFDQLTSMLYHIENTKSCGYNLETFKNINFKKDFFTQKYSYQIKKTKKLANFLNNFLKQQSEITDRNFIKSLKYFILTKLNLNELHEELDSLIIGYGVYLNDEINGEQTCIFVENGTFTNNCFQQESNYYDDNASSGSLNNDDVFNYNCGDWYTNLKNSFNSEIRQFDGLNYDNDELLQNLTSNKNFNYNQWCGPFYDCTQNEAKTLFRSWVVLYSLPLFDFKRQIQGAFLLKLNVTNIDVNQCDNYNDDPLFYNTHKCKNHSICVFKPHNGFKSGGYICACKSGYGNFDSIYSLYDGVLMEREFWKFKNMKSNEYNMNFNCKKCKFDDCCNINDNHMNNSTIKCEQRHNMILRYILLVIQSTCILLTIILAVLVFHYRHMKVIKHSMWILLEMTLLGAALLYSTILVQFFEPSKYLCIIIPWFREVGFIIVFGILNLRLYKILAEFQSRKAHCVQIKDKDLLRILLFIIICVIGYLAAWTLVDLEYTNEGFDLTKNILKNGYKYKVCKIKWWDYFIEIAEFTFLCVGFYFLYCTRMAPSEYNERKYISIVLYSECFISTSIHIIMKQTIWYVIHPDILFLLYFIRCHLTVTIMMISLFFSKLYFLFQPSADDYCRSARLSTIDGVEINSEIAKFHLNSGNNGCENDTLDVNLSELDQDEIKAELKRLYMQLHIQKLKSVKADNPHIPSKRRNNRKNRRFSNTFQKALGGKDYESVTMKTPEESICSNDITTAHGAFFNNDDSSSPSVMNFTNLNNFAHLSSNNTASSTTNQDNLDRDSFSNKFQGDISQQINRVQFKS